MILGSIPIIQKEEHMLSDTSKFIRMIDSIKKKCRGFDQSLMFLLGINYQKFSDFCTPKDFLEIAEKVQNQINSPGSSEIKIRRIFRTLLTQEKLTEVLDLSYFSSSKKYPHKAPKTKTNSKVSSLQKSFTEKTTKTNNHCAKRPVFSSNSYSSISALKPKTKKTISSYLAKPKPVRPTTARVANKKIAKVKPKTFIDKEEEELNRKLSEILEEELKMGEGTSGGTFGGGVKESCEEEKKDEVAVMCMPVVDLTDPFLEEEKIETRSKVLEKKEDDCNFPECPICFEKISIVSLALIECGHMYHKDCLGMYSKLKVETKSFPILCPAQSCATAIPDFDIRNVLSEEMYQKYERFQFDSFIDLHSDLYHHCPSPDCKYVFEWNPRKDPAKLSCPVCSTEHCLKCRVRWHSNFTCEEFEKYKEADPDDMQFYNYAKGNKYQQCTKCKFWVEKKEGCDHITCRCKYEFCYICGGEHQKCGCSER